MIRKYTDLTKQKEYIVKIKEILETRNLHSFNYTFDLNDIRCQISYGVSLRTLNILQQKIPNYDISVNVNNNNVELIFKRLQRFSEKEEEVEYF